MSSTPEETLDAKGKLVADLKVVIDEARSSAMKALRMRRLSASILP